jgi:hypothetical protein
MRTERRAFEELRITKTELHDLLKAEIQEIGERDTILELIDDPEDSSKYLIKIEKL